MRLDALCVRGVRNLAPLDLELGPRFNVLSGDNGQGKTNLLEAIYAAVTLRSFRTAHLGELIAFGQEEARIAARVETRGLERVYEVRLLARPGGAARRPLIDGKAVRPVARYFGDVNVVLFAPEDLAVPRGSPSHRRRFLDRGVFNRNAAYLAQVQSFDKVLRSRNAILRRRAQGGPLDLALLDVYDDQLSRVGAEITRARSRFVADLRPCFRAAFEAIARSGLEADVRYEPRFPEDAASSDVVGAFAARLLERRPLDVARGTTSVGPHRDDLVFCLDGHPAASTASQGQLRALVLAWKTSELDLTRETLGAPPLLLLDDVSSELDDLRNRYLFEFVKASAVQCVITTTHERYVLVHEDRLDFSVVEGVVSPQKCA